MATKDLPASRGRTGALRRPLVARRAQLGFDSLVVGSTKQARGPVLTNLNSEGAPAASKRSTDSSRMRGAAKWVAMGVGGAILAGVGGLIYQSLQERVSDPVKVNVRADPSYFRDKRPNWTPYFYYLPTKESEITTPPKDCRDRRPWAWDQKGSDADETRLALTLTGSRPREVSLDSISVEIVSRKPLNGGVVAACPVGGASGDIHGINIDLNAEKATFVKGGEEIPARFTLADGETETFDVYAFQFDKPQVVEWRLVLNIVDGSDRPPLTIDDNGKPFRTAGAAVAKTPMMTWTDGQWTRYRP